MATRVLGEVPKLRVIEGGARDVASSLLGTGDVASKDVASR